MLTEREEKLVRVAFDQGFIRGLAFAEYPDDGPGTPQRIRISTTSVELAAEYAQRMAAKSLSFDALEYPPNVDMSKQQWEDSPGYDPNWRDHWFP